MNNWFKKFTDSVLGSKPVQAVSGLAGEGASSWRLSDRAAENFINWQIRMGYIAAIPWRGVQTTRNAMQPFQLLLPRIGGSSFAAGFNKAFNPSSMKESWEYAVKVGALDKSVFPQFASTQTLGPTSARAIDTLGVKAAQLGGLFDKFVGLGFDIFRFPDDAGRVIALFSMRHRLGRVIKKFNNGDYNNASEGAFEKMLIEGKVKTFNETAQVRFEQMYKAGDIEGAKDFLGVELAGDSFLRYGHAAHPAGWQTVQGRLFGQFGSFSVQYLDRMRNGLTVGTVKDRAEFLFGHTLVNSGIVISGAAVGLNLATFSMVPAVHFEGGPSFSLGVDFWQAYSGSPAEQSLARRNIANAFPTFNNPRSMFIPLSYSITDIWEGWNADDEVEGLLKAFGFRQLREMRRQPLSLRALEWLDEF